MMVKVGLDGGGSTVKTSLKGGRERSSAKFRLEARTVVKDRIETFQA